jgi:hypothetical protein
MIGVGSGGGFKVAGLRAGIALAKAELDTRMHREQRRALEAYQQVVTESGLWAFMTCVGLEWSPARQLAGEGACP